MAHDCHISLLGSGVASTENAMTEQCSPASRWKISLRKSAKQMPVSPQVTTMPHCDQQVMLYQMHCLAHCTGHVQLHSRKHHNDFCTPTISLRKSAKLHPPTP